jgi:hypothetical protein
MSEEKADFHLIDKQPISKKDWEISELYSKAWNVVKNHKVTWIFGAAVAATAMGSSGNFNSSSSGNSESIQKLFNGGLPEASSSAEMSKVLGESINPFQQLFSEIIQRIPVYYYFILAGEILFMILLAIIITIIYRAWAHASLIASVDSAYKHNKTSISQASEAGFKHFKSFIWLDIVPGIALFLISMIFFIAIVLGFMTGNTIVMVLTGLIALVGGIFFVYYAILISIGIIWGYREVAISNHSAKQAFLNGFKIAKKKKSASIILGFLNGVITGIATMIPMFAVFAVIAAGVISYIATNNVSPYLIGIGVLVIAVVIPVIIVIGAVSQAFKASVWTIAYDKIRGKYTNE